MHDCNKARHENTFVSSRHSQERIVVERWEEMLIWGSDVLHPLKEILGPGVIECIVDEVPRHSHVGGSLGNEEIMRNWLLLFSCAPVF
jgi:hypothetical protein